MKPTREKLAKFDHSIDEKSQTGADRLSVFSKKSGLSMRSNRGAIISSKSGHRTRLMNRVMDYDNQRGVETIPENLNEEIDGD